MTATSPIFDRTPPQNIYAERAVLGAVIINNAALDDAASVLGSTGAPFYVEAHKAVYEAAIHLREKGQPVDAVTLPEALGERLEAAGGFSYLGELTGSVPTSVNAEHYAKQVMDAHIKRQLIAAGGKVAMHGYGAAPAEEALDASEALLFRVAQIRRTGGAVRIRDVLPGVQERLRAIGGGKGLGVPCGIAPLDEITSGFQDGDFVVLAARPSVGKTAFALCAAHHAAAVERTPVLFFSLEMEDEQLTQRLLSINTGVDVRRLYAGFQVQAELAKMEQGAAALAEVPFFIEDAPGASLWEIRSTARKFISKHKDGIVFIDYLQLVKPGGERKDRQRYIEVGDMTRGLKQLARELHAPVVVACQLGRSAEKEHDIYRMLPHLRESGDIEQDADVVIILAKIAAEVREEAGTESDAENIVQCCVAKQRNGPIGKVNLLFEKHSQRFLPLADVRTRQAFGGAEVQEDFPEYEEEDSLI
jgi:replicative DNA helicase